MDDDSNEGGGGDNGGGGGDDDGGGGGDDDGGNDDDDDDDDDDDGDDVDDSNSSGMKWDCFKISSYNSGLQSFILNHNNCCWYIDNSLNILVLLCKTNIACFKLWK